MRLWEHVYRRSRDDLPAWRLSYSAPQGNTRSLGRAAWHGLLRCASWTGITTYYRRKACQRANQAPDACLDVYCRGFWERQRAAFFDIRVCHPNADSYRDLSPRQIYRVHENEKKRKYNSRVREIEQGTFPLLVFTTTGGMANECLRYHSRLAELLP